MSLLNDIQVSLLREGAPLAPILLKFKLLAARLKSRPLKEWIAHELEGYPTDAEVPEYRKLQVAFHGTFSGPFGSGINNAPIPTYLVEKFAGPKWSGFEMRQSIAAVDELISSSNKNGVLHFDCSNLILILQGKIYENYACNAVDGSFSVSQLTELQHVVRSRLLDMAIEFEALPGALEIMVGKIEETQASENERAVNQIFHQTVYGTMQNVNNSGTTGDIKFSGNSFNTSDLIQYLSDNGIPKEAAEEFAEALKTEGPESKDVPFGQKAKLWLADNLKKALDGTWKIGIGTATEVLSKGAISYYGLE